VIVELFTSEGCSSCPPADAVLARLQRSQPVSDALVIPLSEHVDYWNYIGWTDPFSSSSASDRQRSYAEALHLQSVYTPQMVVNGQAEFVGSDAPRAEAAIARAAEAPHADIEATIARGTGPTARVDVRVSGLPGPARGDTAEVMLAITEDNLRSRVTRGENAGRSLPHVAVVRQIRAIGRAVPGRAFTANPTVMIDPAWKSADLSAVVFVQEQASRRILGAARVSLAPSDVK
jgi:hypothetical protein